MATALVLLAPGFEEIEAVTIIDILRRGGVTVTVAGLQEGLITGSHEIAIQPDVYYQQVHAEDFDLLILPGGQPGTENLKRDETVLEWLRRRREQGQPIAAICAAPTVLQQAGIARGLKVTSYPTEKDVFTESEYLEEAVVEDAERQIITSRGVGTAITFALRLVEKLAGRAQAQEVARRILVEY